MAIALVEIAIVLRCNVIEAFPRISLRMNIGYFYVQANLLVAAMLLGSAASVSIAQVLTLSPSRNVGPVWGLAFSPNSEFLAAAGGQRNAQGVIQVWETRDWSEAYSILENRAATRVAFSTDNQRIAIGLQNGEIAGMCCRSIGWAAKTRRL